jgi:hypothetical protein
MVYKNTYAQVINLKKERNVLTSNYLAIISYYLC